MQSMIRAGVGLVMLLSATASAHARQGPAPYPTPTSFEAFRFANPADEIALARSAAPPSIANAAEVLTLGPKGYETAVKGANGFVCLVDRAWSKPFDDPEFWNPKVRAPECWNRIAASSVLPTFLERTRWVMAGAPKDEIEKRTRAAAKGAPAPEQGNLVFMMSKQQYLSDGAVPHWHPHVMFYFPTNAVPPWGENLKGSPVVQADDDAIGISTVFVMAPTWSDGTPATMEMKPPAAMDMK